MTKDNTIDNILMEYGGYCIKDNSTYNKAFTKATAQIEALIQDAVTRARIDTVRDLIWRHSIADHAEQELLDKISEWEATLNTKGNEAAKVGSDTNHTSEPTSLTQASPKLTKELEKK